MIKVSSLSKKFGDFYAIKDISFEVAEGEIFGLLGENGAGKTTTLRTIATMLKPSEGTAEISGYDIIEESEKARGCIGILFGGESGLYDRLTAYENIEYFSRLNGMAEPDIKERIKYLSTVFGIDDFLNKRAGKFSKGMKQKVAFARAIVHNPNAMLFDEPTTGLDVSTIRDVHEFIMNCSKEGKSIILSSHTMSEVEKLCNRIGIIHKGNLIDVGTTSELISKYGKNSLEEVFIELVGGNR